MSFLIWHEKATSTTLDITATSGIALHYVIGTVSIAVVVRVKQVYSKPVINYKNKTFIISALYHSVTD